MYIKLVFNKGEEDSSRLFASNAGEKFTLPNGTVIYENQLTAIEGIGPKIADLLEAAGISTWRKLAQTSPTRLLEILMAAGPRYNMHDPNTWPVQAALCVEHNWRRLISLQDELKGGRIV